MNSHDQEIITAIVEQGWSVTRAFLPEPYVKALAAEARQGWERERFRHAGVGRGGSLQIRPEIRSDYVCWLDPEHLTPLQQTYWQTMEQLREHLNRELFLGLRKFEGHFAVYPPGAFYQRHLDQFRGVHYRLITCILYFNEGWQPAHGGQLRIYHPGEEGRETYTDVLPEFGTFVCFRSDAIYHEVLPGRRERFSLTGWLRKEGV